MGQQHDPTDSWVAASTGLGDWLWFGFVVVPAGAPLFAVSRNRSFRESDRRTQSEPRPCYGRVQSYPRTAVGGRFFGFRRRNLRRGDFEFSGPVLSEYRLPDEGAGASDQSRTTRRFDIYRRRSQLQVTRSLSRKCPVA